MANRWNVMQNKPKRKRRAGIDFYEFCTFLTFIALGTIGLLILLKFPGDTFDHVSDNRNGIVGIGFLVSGLALIKFDTNARIRAAKKFTYDLAEYELIRTKWLEMEATKIDLQKEYSLQYLAMGQNTVIVDNPVNVEKIPAPPEEDVVDESSAGDD